MERSRRRQWFSVTLLFGLWLPYCLTQTTASNSATMTPKPSSSPQPQTQRLKVRLAGYPRKHNEGRIELFYKGEWGTICDDDFAIANANVLCRQLGFVEATGWTHSAKYGKGQGEPRLDIWFLVSYPDPYWQLSCSKWEVHKDDTECTVCEINISTDNTT